MFLFQENYLFLYCETFFTLLYCAKTICPVLILTLIDSFGIVSSLMAIGGSSDVSILDLQIYLDLFFMFG